MKMYATLSRTLLLASLLTGTAAHADALVLTDPLQFGRLSRNGIAQDWSHFTGNPATDGEPYPGVINPTTPYHYRQYFYNVGSNPFVEISIDSLAATTFFSAYQTYYNPGDLAQDWLGDAGSSSNYAFDAVPADAQDPRYFQVVAGINTTLIVVVNESTTNGGLDLPFTLQLTGHTDSQYSDGIGTDLSAVPAASRIPEPSTVLLLLAPLAVAASRRIAKRGSKTSRLEMA